MVNERLRKRGYLPTRRRLGEIHTLAFVPRESWHNDLYDDLGALGPVSEFDYVKFGYRLNELLQGGLESNQRRKEMNQLFFSFVRESHKKKPIDWMFMYASGSELAPDYIRKIQDTFGFPIVGMCFDDKHSWKGPLLDGYYGLQIDIAPVLDLAWTSSLVATEWYLASGGVPIHLPEGTNPRVYARQEVGKDIDVSFVGARYGFRPIRIEFLRRNGIDIRAFGAGWNTGFVSQYEMVKIYNRSRINLGMGGINFSERLTNVKGRDFDIPCTGNFYITTFNPELALYFTIGKEIVCYSTADELLELVRYYLAHPDEALEIGLAGRVRCLREHTWFHRFKTICETLGVLEKAADAS
jgi:hypothetical protein